MTRKHFEALAEALRFSQPPYGDHDRWSQWDADVKAIATACKQFNANFDVERFLDACEGGK